MTRQKPFLFQVLVAVLANVGYVRYTNNVGARFFVNQHTCIQQQYLCKIRVNKISNTWTNNPTSHVG